MRSPNEMSCKCPILTFHARREEQLTNTTGSSLDVDNKLDRFKCERSVDQTNCEAAQIEGQKGKSRRAKGTRRSIDDGAGNYGRR
jgi:hypothetical protein